MTAAESTAGSTTIAIDRTLADLIVVGMLAKHAQWNIVGPVCRSMGALFDGLADMSRRHSDAVAERAAILGHHPDGRAETIGRDNTLPTVHAGELTDDTAIRAFDAILESVVTRLHEAIEDVADDPVTRDLFTNIVGSLERQAWMIRSHRTPAT